MASEQNKLQEHSLHCLRYHSGACELPWWVAIPSLRDKCFPGHFILQDVVQSNYCGIILYQDGYIAFFFFWNPPCDQCVH